MSTQRGRLRPLSPFLALALLAGAWMAARRWLDVVEVQGDSMQPSLLPGDRLLVEAWTYRRRSPRRGEIVLAADPREPRRELIKRVHATGPRLELRGDAPERSTDSRSFGAVARESVQWRARLRYWPPRRVGLI
jgi:nickel-type superoxide dismutase maturation protease